jgi:hypothetical protein
MSNPKSPTPTATDWTRLLADPELVSHLGKLLQTYREAPPEKREEALLAAMREIKSTSPQKAVGAAAGAGAHTSATHPCPGATSTMPPFEPDIFTPSWGHDRRRYPRMKCFVAVELKIGGSDTPVWGHLSNTSLGGCFVETVTPVEPGLDVEIGLWLASGKIWVKGIVLTGIVTRSNPSFGVRVKFAELEATERENLREFLKFVENTTKSHNTEQGYLAQLKR